MTASSLRSPCPTCGGRDHYHIALGNRPLPPECLAVLITELAAKLRSTEAA